MPDRADIAELVLRHDGGSVWARTAPVFIGREADNHILLSGPKASRHHAVVYRLGSDFVVRDLHSKTGLTLNGEQVTTAVLADGDRVRLAGERVDIERGAAQVPAYQSPAVILDADVIGYGALRARYGQAFADRLADVLEHLLDEVLLRRGCPLKNRGDGLKAVFGIWVLDDRRHSPIDAALGFANLARTTVQKEVFNLSREADSADLRVGLACGDAEHLQDQGLEVVGRPAQLAIALREANRVYGTNILMCGDCRAGLRVADHLRELDTVSFADAGQTTVWGFDDRSHIRQVASTAVTDEAALAAPLMYLDMYAQALALYRQGQLDAAFKLFGETYKGYRDRPARAMRDRCAQMGEKPADWDGVWRA